MHYEHIVQKTRAYLCLDCGKCTGSCPLARVDPEYSPRRIVERVLFGEAQAELADPQLWSCMTCGLCSSRCPSNVDFTRFIVAMRAEAFKAGERGVYAHSGILQTIMRFQALAVEHENDGQTVRSGAPEVTPDRTHWIDEDLAVSEEGDIFYFVGCLPFFEVIFADLGIQPLEIARSAVRLLNRAGIEPIVSSQERCCGADLLLAGDVDSFRRLADRNVATIKASGARRVVFSCAECYNAFKTDYPTHLGPLPFELLHITEQLAPRVASRELTFQAASGRIAYHDPCRMGRYLRIHEPPRVVIRGVPGLELVEMADSRERATCCGSTAWVNCGGGAQAIQLEKLHQARESGARVMLTTCPKCQIHLACASRKQDPNTTIGIQDVLVWAARALK